jgi:hypothetical protein
VKGGPSLIRSRAVVTMLSIWFELRTGFQCLAKKSGRARSAVRSLTRQVTALSSVAPYLLMWRWKGAAASAVFSASACSDFGRASGTLAAL